MGNITGDTMIFNDIKDISKRFPNVDIALLHLGGTTIMGIVVTMDAKQPLFYLFIYYTKHIVESFNTLLNSYQYFDTS